jgi:hypothetical protein
MGDRESCRSVVARRWLVTFLLLLAFAGAWIAITPPGGGPDEPAHAVKAAAVVSGQLTGRTTEPPDGGARMVDVPQRLKKLSALPICYAFNGTAPAGCAPSYTGPSRVGPVYTAAGLSPPLYYALVGLPIRYVPTLDGLYLARLLSAAIACALVATAVQLAVAARSGFLVAAVAVAWTPMALSLTALVNPSSLEISAAILVWTAGLLIVRPAAALPAWLDRWLPWLFALAASAFALSRQLSPVFLACIVFCLSVAASHGRLRELVRDRRTWLPAGVTAVATAAAAAWIVLFPPGPPAVARGTDYGPRSLLAIPLGQLGELYSQMIGRFGWLDVSPPFAARLAWTATVGVLIVGGVSLGGRRLIAAIAACLAITVVVPTLFEASQLNEYGNLLQGRYIMPLAMGTVLLGGRAIDVSDPVLIPRILPVVRTMLVLLVIGHLVSIWFAARRFAVGTNGRVLFVGHERWDPGVPLVIPLAIGAAALVALAWFTWRQVAPSADRSDDEEPHTGPAAAEPAADPSVEPVGVAV